MAAPPPVDISPAIAAAESLLADLRAFEAGQAAMPPGAHNALLRKAHALRRAIETPYDVVGHFVESAVLYGALWTLVGLGAMDALPDPAATNGVNGHAAPPGISAEELAALLQRTKGARVDASIIGRALRAAAGQEIGTELAPGRFAHNARSRAFTLAPPGIGGFMRVSLDFAGTAVRIPEWVAAHQGAGQEEYFLDRRKSPFAWTRGKEGRTYYECIDEDESYRELFYITMDSTEKMLPVKGMFPFAELRGAVEEAKGKEGEEERPFVIDVGGGFGRALVAIGEEVAEWRDEVKPRMVLQELQVVVERLGKDDLPGVERMVHDMFTPQPLKSMSPFISSVSPAPILVSPSRNTNLAALVSQTPTSTSSAASCTITTTPFAPRSCATPSLPWGRTRASSSATWWCPSPSTSAVPPTSGGSTSPWAASAARRSP